MTIAELDRVATALYGPRWQRELARLLDANERTVRYWVAGARPVPDELPERLAAAIAARIAELNDLRKILAKR